MLSKIEISLLLILSILSFSQSALTDFFRKIAGVRDFKVSGNVVFQVRSDSGELSRIEISGVIAVRNLEDLYIKIEKPEILSGLAFVYINDSKRLYSLYDSKVDMDTVEMEENPIEKILSSVIDVISSPFFSYSVKKTKGGEVYKFFPVARSFLNKVGIEPITIEVVFEGCELRGIRITGDDDDEYVEIEVEYLVVNADVDKLFNLSM